MSKGCILILAYYYPPENTSGAARPFRFSKYLPKYGYSTYVVARSDVNREDHNVYYVSEKHPERWGTAILIEAARIVQRVLPYNELLPWVPAALAAVRKVIPSVPISGVVSTSPPIATHLVALELKYRYGLPWLADFRDPLLDNPFRERPFNYDAALERLIFRHADAIIANTDATAAVWQRRYPRWRQKITTIWNGFDPEDDCGPAPIPSRGYRVLAHVGSLYSGRHPGVLLSSMERLKAQGRLDLAWRVHLVGPIQESCLLPYRSSISVLRSKGCLEYDGRTVSRQEATRIISEADYLLLLDVNTFNTGFQVPAKIFDYIRVGRPIMAFTARNSPTDWILSNSGAPHTCIYNDDSPEQIDNKVMAFASLPTTPTSPTPWFREQFNGIAQTETLSLILDHIQGKQNNPASASASREIRPGFQNGSMRHSNYPWEGR